MINMERKVKSRVYLSSVLCTSGCQWPFTYYTRGVERQGMFNVKLRYLFYDSAVCAKVQMGKSLLHYVPLRNASMSNSSILIKQRHTVKSHHLSNLTLRNKIYSKLLLCMWSLFRGRQNTLIFWRYVWTLTKVTFHPHSPERYQPFLSPPIRRPQHRLQSYYLPKRMH